MLGIWNCTACNYYNEKFCELSKHLLEFHWGQVLYDYHFPNGLLYFVNSNLMNWTLSWCRGIKHLAGKFLIEQLFTIFVPSVINILMCSERSVVLLLCIYMLLLINLLALKSKLNLCLFFVNSEDIGICICVNEFSEKAFP